MPVARGRPCDRRGSPANPSSRPSIAVRRVSRVRARACSAASGSNSRRPRSPDRRAQVAQQALDLVQRLGKPLAHRRQVASRLPRRRRFARERVDLRPAFQQRGVKHDFGQRPLHALPPRRDAPLGLGRAMQRLAGGARRAPSSAGSTGASELASSHSSAPSSRSSSGLVSRTRSSRAKSTDKPGSARPASACTSSSSASSATSVPRLGPQRLLALQLARLHEAVEPPIERPRREFALRRHGVARGFEPAAQVAHPGQPGARRQQRLGELAAGLQQHRPARPQALGIEREQPLQSRQVGPAEQPVEQRRASSAPSPSSKVRPWPLRRTSWIGTPVALPPRREFASPCSRNENPSGSARRCRTADRRTPAAAPTCPPRSAPPRG